MTDFILSGFCDEMEKIAFPGKIGRHFIKHRGKYLTGAGLTAGLGVGGRIGHKRGKLKGRGEMYDHLMKKTTVKLNPRAIKGVDKKGRDALENMVRSAHRAKTLGSLAEKTASIKESIPWAVSRGLTGAGSTVIIGLTMNKVLSDLKKRQKAAETGKLKVSNFWDKKFVNKRPKLKKTISKMEALAPLAAVGGGIGLAKGFSEKSIERGLKTLLKVK